MADADPWIATLRAVHDSIVGATADLDRRALTRPSGCAEWDVAGVLGHLGSGAEIGLATLEAAVERTMPPARESLPAIWARWDSMAPEARRDAFTTWDDRLVARFEALDERTRATLRIQLSFAPAPLDVATVVGFRLTEETLHAWDVRVSRDRTATLDARATALLLDQAPAMAGFLGRPLGSGHLALSVEVSDPARTFSLEADEDAVSLEPGPHVDAGSRLRLPAEALLRLLAGRLPADCTPGTIVLESETVGLDELRHLFPGY